jgi:hypothetical protein
MQALWISPVVAYVSPHPGTGSAHPINKGVQADIGAEGIVHRGHECASRDKGFESESVMVFVEPLPIPTVYEHEYRRIKSGWPQKVHSFNRRTAVRDIALQNRPIEVD